MGGAAGVGGGYAAEGGVLGEGGAGGDVTEGGAAGAAPTPAAVSLSLGAFHSCALFDDENVRCWGSGGDGFLGLGHDRTIGDDETPAAAGDVDVGGRVQSISASWYHTCAVLNGGRVRCWGGNSHGKLGYPGVDVVGDDETPASVGDVDVGGPVRRVLAAPDHTCAILTNGRVRCWGDNGRGQLGYDDPSPIGDDETPAFAGDVELGGLVADLAAGWDYTCALMVDGRVRCWGDGSSAVRPDVALGGKAVSIAAGLNHACALLDDNRVRCWGSSYDGATGYGNRRLVREEEVAQAGDVPIGGAALQITAGAYAACSLLTGGSLRCWGLNEHGELGYGHEMSIGDDETPSSAGDVGLGASASLVALGFQHACAVTDAGRVRCWGRGGTAALGYGNELDIGDDELPSTAGDVETH